MAKFLVLCLVLLNAFVATASFDAEAPAIRKLGKHGMATSPSQASHTEKNMHHPVVGSPYEGQTAAISETNSGENASVEGETIHARKPRRSVDESVAGGGVILGGLATTFLVAVFCYIRATRRHKSEGHQSDIENQ